jgi:hypothetical protein
MGRQARISKPIPIAATPTSTPQLLQGLAWIISLDFQRIGKTHIHRQLSDQTFASSFIPLAKLSLNVVHRCTEELDVSIRV